MKAKEGAGDVWKNAPSETNYKGPVKKNSRRAEKKLSVVSRGVALVLSTNHCTGMGVRQSSYRLDSKQNEARGEWSSSNRCSRKWNGGATRGAFLYKQNNGGSLSCLEKTKTSSCKLSLKRRSGELIYLLPRWFIVSTIGMIFRTKEFVREKLWGETEPEGSRKPRSLP